MKPFKRKYVLYHQIGDAPEISTFTYDKDKRRIPVFYDKPVQALDAIIADLRIVSESVKKGWMTVDSLMSHPMEFIALATLDNDNHLTVYTETDDEEFIYEGDLYRAWITR